MNSEQKLYALISRLADGAPHTEQELTAIGFSSVELQHIVLTILPSQFSVQVLQQGKYYRLLTTSSLLDKQNILHYWPDAKIEILPCIDSTNRYLLQKIRTLKNGHACAAEYQYAGRGRRGHVWHSPFGKNIYLSLFWHFSATTIALQGLSLMVSIVVAEVLQQYGVDAIKLKWPNDLILHNKKLGGILVECVSSKAVVIGIGINVAPCELWMSHDHEISRVATSIASAHIYPDRNQLIASILKQLTCALTQFEYSGLIPLLPIWRKFDDFLNKPITLKNQNGNKKHGIARGINQQGAILLEQNHIISAYFDVRLSLR